MHIGLTMPGEPHSTPGIATVRCADAVHVSQATGLIQQGDCFAGCRPHVHVCTGTKDG